MFCDDANQLLETFKDEFLILKKGETKSEQYRSHVNYIWTVVDPKIDALPYWALANCLLVEDKYHKKHFHQWVMVAMRHQLEE